MMLLPPLTPLRQADTHRLIPSQFSTAGESPLSRLSDNAGHLAQLLKLEQATNDRYMGERDLLPGIGRHELVFDLPNSEIINGSFTHAHPYGSRFNSAERGAWYSGFELATSQAEITFHKTLEYAEINRFDDIVFYDDYLADFNGPFHDIRNAEQFRNCLDSASYIDSQRLAEELLEAKSLGIIYPSVRLSGGTCLACFRPAAVANVRKGLRYQFSWKGTPVPELTCLGSNFKGFGQKTG